jgi:hypothetical protein
VSVFLGSLFFSGLIIGKKIEFIDKKFNSPIKNGVTNNYTFLGLSLMSSVVGLYSIFKDRQYLKQNMLTVYEQLKEIFKQIFREMIRPETPEEKTQREIRELRHEIRNLTGAIKKNKDDEQSNKQSKEEKENKHKSKEREASTIAKVSAVTICSAVFVLGSVGLFYVALKGPQMVRSYIESRRRYYNIRNQSANLRVLAFNLEEDKKLAKNAGIELPNV